MNGVVAGLTLGAPEGGLYIAFNAGHKALVAQLPDWPGRTWVPLVDTGKVGACLTGSAGPCWDIVVAGASQSCAL